MNKNPHLSAMPALGTGNYHTPSWRKILAAIASLLVVSLSLCHAAQSCMLAWDASSDSSIAGYRLRYGTNSGNLSQTAPDVSKTATRTVSNLNDGTTYYFAVTAFNAAGIESAPSNQVSYRTPTTPTSNTHVLTVINGTGSGSHPANAEVPVSATVPAGQQFAIWIGDDEILANRLSSTTTATMIMDATIEATFTGGASGDKIRYYPRNDSGDRMVGGIFEGANDVSGPYTSIHMITANSQGNWIEVSKNLGNYQYLRYRGPNGSYGNVAEIEFYRGGVKLTGTGYGSPGSWNNNGATFDKALDGNVNTFFDGPTGDGMYVGINTGGSGPPANEVTALAFSEGSGNVAADNSGSGHNGTLVNGTTWTAGKFGNGLSLDGTNDYVLVANPSTLNFGTSDFTIALWMKRQETGVEHTIFNKTANASWTSGGKEFFINGSNSTLGFGSFGAGEVFSTGTITNDGLWHHVAVTFVNSSKTVTFYIDGVARGGGTLNLPADVGSHAVKVGDGLRGQVDELRIFDRALSSSEVQSVMNNAIR